MPRWTEAHYLRAQEFLRRLAASAAGVNGTSPIDAPSTAPRRGSRPATSARAASRPPLPTAAPATLPPPVSAATVLKKIPWKK